MNAFTATATVAEKLFKDLVAQTEAHIKRDGGLPPHFMIYTSEGRLLVIEPVRLDDATKPLVYAAVRCACIAHGASVIAFLHEIWCLSVDPGLPIPDLRPSQSERRIEAAFVSCCWLEAGERRHLFSCREIIRNATGGVGSLGRELFEDKDIEVGGVLAELLPASPSAQATRQRAQRDLDQMCRLGIIEVQEPDSMTSN
ncbi:MAG: hypothetical protein B7Z80_15555 [Rhodospirillales bacterium 20-64-7]|nr:MAG: hypothetical protein B7Z80_15555 [Rhodospirillales bacterium 20-64-7]